MTDYSEGANMTITEQTTDPRSADDIRAALDSIGPAVAELVELQVEYDAVGWQISSPLASKFRHVLYHLRAASHGFDRMVEANEHAEHNGEPVTDGEVLAMVASDPMAIADLVFSALQLAELGGVDIVDALAERWSANAATFAPGSSFDGLTG